MSLVRLFLQNPVFSLVAGFLILILVGTVLLLLPWSHKGSLSWIDALFTATSAATVTGLVVKSTANDFTLFGQIIILLLIQFGAIGIMTGAAFFFLLIKKDIGLTYQANLKKGFEEEYIGEVINTVKFIIITTFLLEAIGAFFLWLAGFRSSEYSLFFLIFHSISAFGNAGFSLTDNSLEFFRDNLTVNIIFALLIISGGLGYIVLKDIKNNLVGLLERQATKLSLHSKLVLWTSFILIILGALGFYIFENSNSIFHSQGEAWLASFFQSITARTAGFSTVPISQLSLPTLFLLMILMFIGGAPGSTAGGVKVTAVVLAALGARALWSGKNRVIIFKKEIASEIVQRALVSILILLFVLAVFILLLLYFEDKSFEYLLFEAFSAFGTVGLTTGITPSLTLPGKIIFICLMFIGRLAPLTLAILGGKKILRVNLRYPEERITLG